jgi:2'-5' RNA ligase
MRLFVALPLPDEVRAALAHAQARLQRAGLPLRLARAEGLHVTLAFLGEVSEDRVDELGAIIDAAARPGRPFRLGVGGLGCFPTPHRPRVVWQGLRGEVDRAAALQSRLAAGLRQAEFVLDDRPFAPHITLGRSVGAWSAAALQSLAALLANQPPDGGDWLVDGIDLMRSELRRDGSRYTTLYTSRLGQALTDV